LNYRHAFHAGNFADLLKHAALLELLAQMTAAGPPLEVIDTHAGRGLYDLAGPEAQRSGEADAGVGRLLEASDAPGPLVALRRQVEALNARGGGRRYPGSPWLIAQALRPQDSYLACELRPEEHAVLASVLKGRANVRTACVDGFAAAAKAPEPTGRRLMLVDPPFEKADDYSRSAELLGRASRHAGALVMVWLPLKDLETFDRFLRDAEDAGAGALLVAEVRMRPLTDPMKMNGCALVLAGAPPDLAGVLDPVCAWVAGLGEQGLGRAWWSAQL
jgi:23S rRNA (adenine2030-N6)-methyltransferase